MQLATVWLATLLLATTWTLRPAFAAEELDGMNNGWKSLQLVENGQVASDWVHLGYGKFEVVDDDKLQTVPDERGLGLLVYRKEKLGNCEIRIVYRVKTTAANSGLYVRVDDGILQRLDEKHAPAKRADDGGLTAESEQIFKDASEKELGPWYAVHHGYEIQICDGTDPFSRTGAVYSLVKSSAEPKEPGPWRTMIVKLDGEKISVSLDGETVSRFEPGSSDVPKERKWYQPKREPVRPEIGYIGLQTHDPGDIVTFSEVSVRPLRK